MPELPEVENIKLQLDKYLTGHVIEKIDINYPKSFQGESSDIIGGKVTDVRRFGKMVSIDLDNGYSLAIHVKMTGQLIYRGPNLNDTPKLSEKVTGGLNGKHTHVVFHLDKSGKLYFNDVRKFGWIKVIPTDEVESMDFVKRMGPEPLDGLTLEKFSSLVQSTGRAIKTLLMDQSKIGGVGNIYANDSLFLAKIHPEKKANKLSGGQVTKLFNAIENVLKKGLKYGGSSQSAYIHPDGTVGEYQKHFLIYEKGGKSCPNCEAKIEKIKVGGRGTFFCPSCQKK